MKVEKTYLEDEHQLRLIVEIEQDVYDKAKYLASKTLSKGIKIPGFRPGKAPYNMVVQHVGEERINHEALENILDDVYPNIVKDLEEELYGPGQLVEVQSLEPLTFELLIPLQYKVELGEYQSIRVPYEAPTIEQEDIDEVIRQQRLQQATVEEVDTPAEENSLVDLKISGKVVDADPDDEDAQIMVNQPLPVLIKFEDDDDSKEWPFPGFSRQLLGASAGDSLELVYEYPDTEDVNEDLRGKEVLYSVSVENIRDRVLPEFDDEFVQSISNLKTPEELVERLRENMEAQALADYESEYVEEVLDAILEVSDVKYSTPMLEDKVEERFKSISENIEAQGLELEAYLEMRDIDEDQLREEITADVKPSLLRGLLMSSILDTENLTVSPKSVTAEYQRVLDNAFGEEDSPERKKFLNSADSIELLNTIASRMTTEFVIDFLIALAKGEDISSFKKSDEDELIDIEAASDAVAGDAEEAEEAEEVEAAEEPAAEEPAATETTPAEEDSPQGEEDAEGQD